MIRKALGYASSQQILNRVSSRNPFALCGTSCRHRSTQPTTQEHWPARSNNGVLGPTREPISEGHYIALGILGGITLFGIGYVLAN